MCAGTCASNGAYAAAAAGFASPDDFRTFLDLFVGAMASSRVELAVALEVVRSAVADGDDLAPLFRAWSGLERQAITKAIANSAVTGGAMPSTAPTASSADPRAEPLSSSDHGPHWAQGGAAARTAPTRWAHRAVGGQARGPCSFLSFLPGSLVFLSSWFPWSTWYVIMKRNVQIRRCVQDI